MDKKEEEVSFGEKVIQNLTAKLAGLDRQNSMLFVENTDLKIENEKLKKEVEKCTSTSKKTKEA